MGTIAVASFSFAAGPGSSLPSPLGASGSTLSRAGMRTGSEPEKLGAGGYTPTPSLAHTPTAAAAASRRYIGREREADAADRWLTERADSDDRAAAHGVAALSAAADRKVAPVLDFHRVWLRIIPTTSSQVVLSLVVSLLGAPQGGGGRWTPVGQSCRVSAPVPPTCLYQHLPHTGGAGETCEVRATVRLWMQMHHLVRTCQIVHHTLEPTFLETNEYSNMTRCALFHRALRLGEEHPRDGALRVPRRCSGGAGGGGD